MRFWTIWTLPACTVKEKLLRTRDWAALEIASKLPKRIRYWVAIKEISKATTAADNIPEASCSYILKHLDAPKVVA